MRYWCCDPMNDPTHWVEVNECDNGACAAATTFAEESCSRDCEMYSVYMDGHEVMVWDGQSMEAVEVRMESVPRFFAARFAFEPTDEMIRHAREASKP